MKPTLKIDFVSDVACPWCAVGLGALQQALQRTQDDFDVTLHFQPFELNPAMGPLGQDASEHLTEKYGSTTDQQVQIRERIRARGAEVGFTFNPQGRARVWNTFDAHRLLHWAGLEDAAKQLALKQAFLEAYHGRGDNFSDPQVLVGCAVSAGLDDARAQAILDSDEFALDVREREHLYQRSGIHSVPAVIINDQHLISGGQPAEVFEQALREIVAEMPFQLR